MSLVSQFLGSTRVPTSLINRVSTAGTSTAVDVDSQAANPAVIALGAATASVYKTILSVTGRGQINFLSAYTFSTNSGREWAVRLTLDGVVVFPRLTSGGAGNTVGFGFYVVGSAGTWGAIFQPVRYQQSLLVELMSTLTETNGVNIAINHEIHA